MFIVNTKETGHGVKAAAHVLDDFTRQGQELKAQEARALEAFLCPMHTVACLTLMLRRVVHISWGAIHMLTRREPSTF